MPALPRPLDRHADRASSPPRVPEAVRDGRQRARNRGPEGGARPGPGHAAKRDRPDQRAACAARRFPRAAAQGGARRGRARDNHGQLWRDRARGDRQQRRAGPRRSRPLPAQPPHGGLRFVGGEDRAAAVPARPRCRRRGAEICRCHHRRVPSQQDGRRDPVRGVRDTARPARSGGRSLRLPIRPAARRETSSRTAQRGHARRRLAERPGGAERQLTRHPGDLDSPGFERFHARVAGHRAWSTAGSARAPA